MENRKIILSTWTRSTPLSNNGITRNTGENRLSWGVRRNAGSWLPPATRLARYGIRSAMSSMKAKQLCPDLIFVGSHMEYYKSVSMQIHEIFHEYTDMIEPLALDEAFLDVTENKKNIPLAVDVAREIKKEIKEKLGLVASAGISYNKFLAKIASDYKKPDGLYTIHPDRAPAFISKLPIEAFWGIGKVTARKMHSLGIHTGADLRNVH